MKNKTAQELEARIEKLANKSATNRTLIYLIFALLFAILLLVLFQTRPNEVPEIKKPPVENGKNKPGPDPEKPIKVEPARQVWPKRYSHSGVYFQNHFWVIGGLGKDQMFNDVWKSADGREWKLVTASAGFSARYAFSTAVLQDRIYLLGGWDGERRNDVWRSRDGSDWERLTEHAEFEPRNSQTLVTFQDKLWMIGGIGSENRFADVWSSEDGAHWEAVQRPAPFPGRNSHQALIFQDRIWILGGFDDDDKRLGDVWSSVDGSTWRKEEKNSFSPRSNFGAGIISGEIWVFGGIDGETLLGDCWKRNSGGDWNRVNLEKPFIAGRDQLALQDDKHFWLFGGFLLGQEKTYSNDTWSLPINSR